MESILHNLHNNGDNNCWKRAWLIACRAESLDFQRFAFWSFFVIPRYDHLLSQPADASSFHGLYDVQNVPVIWFIVTNGGTVYKTERALEYFLYGIQADSVSITASRCPRWKNSRPWRNICGRQCERWQFNFSS